MKSILLGTSAADLKRKMMDCSRMVAIEKKRVVSKRTKKTIPVFFASDNNYLPFLDVAIGSMLENVSEKYDYALYVLHSGIDGERSEKIMRHQRRGVKIRFVNVEEHLGKLSGCFDLRDYYTPAIYYRLFIVNMFPQYKKAIYLDCDTVVLGDVSELYRVGLGRNLIGAVADGVVQGVPVFKKYTKDALGVDGEKYFNSGVIVMNLEEMRKMNFFQTFCDTLNRYRFRVAPDQDCLNILCKDRVHYFSECWNRMPQAKASSDAPKLIHYNLAQKPWHYDGIAYEEYFWNQAKQSVFYQEILAKKNAFTPEMARRDEEGGVALLSLAAKEAEKEDNYLRSNACLKVKH